MGSLASGLAGDLAAALDPVVMARRAGWTPDDWQARVLRSSSSRIILNCSRQSGKSTTIATLALHTAIYHPSSLILLLSPGERQSSELMKKLRDTYRALPDPKVSTVGESVLTMAFAHGSRVVALPGSESTIRGYSGAAMLVIDEASRVDDQLYFSIRPMLAVSSGKLCLLSTPWGRRGFFHKEWVDGGGDWGRYEVPATMCPRISPEFLESERRTMSPFFFNQEYMCQFAETSSQLFTGDDIQASISGDVAPLFGQGGM